MTAVQENKRRMNLTGLMRSWMIVLAMILGGAVSVGAAISEIYQVSDPAAAAKAWPKNGFALNAVVDARLSERVTNSSAGALPNDAAHWQGIGDLATQAYQREPLNAPALRSLALAAEANGDQVQAQKLMANAVKFSRRDTAANNWQFVKALSAKDLGLSLTIVDRILNENDDLRPQYIPVLIASVAEQEGFAAIYPMLKRQPQWEAEFWGMAASQPNLPAEMGALRQRLLEQRRQSTPMVPFLLADSGMIRNLIRNDQFDAAKSLHSYLANQTQQLADRRSRDGGTSDFTAYGSALDWQLTEQGDVQAYLNDSGAGLSVELASNTIGLFARHLVKPDDGKFRLKISAQAGAGIELIARLKCAEKGKKSIAFDLNFEPDSWTVDQAVTRDCRWFMLELLAQNKTLDSALLNIKNIEATSIF